MPKRRSARLLEKEEQFFKKAAKSPHETREPLIQNSFIFDTIRDVLLKIINNLNPCSFVRLARTCKEMSRICFKNKDIQIPCWSGEEDNCCCLSVDGNSTRRWFLEYHSSRGYRVRIKLNDQLLKKTARMPFVYTLKNVSILVQFDDRFNSRLRKFLDHFPRLNIRRIAQCRPVLNWDGFIEFLKDFRITRLSMTSDVNVAPLEVISFLTRNLVDFTYRKDISDDIILGTTAKKMKLFRSSISKETFKQLIQKFVAGGFIWWLIRRGERPLRRREPDAFIEAVSEVIKTVQTECIDKNTMEPYTAYFTPSEPEKFHFLKSDGSLGSFNITPNYVQFGSYVYI